MKKSNKTYSIIPTNKNRAINFFFHSSRQNTNKRLLFNIEHFYCWNEHMIQKVLFRVSFLFMFLMLPKMIIFIFAFFVDLMNDLIVSHKFLQISCNNNIFSLCFFNGRFLSTDKCVWYEVFSPPLRIIIPKMNIVKKSMKNNPCGFRAFT